MKGLIVACAIAALGAGGSVAGEYPYAGESPADKDARMAWWREARFGMFIHWGVYAVPAGSYRDRQIKGIGEWIMLRGQIPVADYRAYAADFNPVRYDPDAWAALAAEAGMKYLVITSKHHDGFALFPSEASDWDVANATPWKNDLIGPLVAAARARGLKFGLYYSQAQDWVHPGGAKAGFTDGDGWDPAHKGSFDEYLDRIAVPQVREILTRYQPDVLWWDTPSLMTPERAARLAPLLALKPGIIHNNRLGGGFAGDTETPEQYIPARGYPGRDWETCMTMNDTWGFKSYDTNWKPVSSLIRNLVDIASKGGNYLLNVGPTAEGEIPAESVKLLREVGAWMKTNGESIYGTTAGPFPRLPWGRCTMKRDGEDTLLYLHVFDWPGDGRLLVPGLRGEIQSAQPLGGEGDIAVEPSDLGPVLVLTAAAPDPVCAVIRVRLAGEPEIFATPVLPRGDGAVVLVAADAELAGSLRLEQRGGHDNIGFWGRPEDTASWTLRASHSGRHRLVIETAANGSGSVLRIEGIGKLAFAVPDTGSFQKYRTTEVGNVNLAAGETLTLTLHPVAEGWRPVNVRKVELLPQP